MTYKKTEGVFKTRKTGMVFGPYAGRDVTIHGLEISNKLYTKILCTPSVP